jgi:hypothetical protein
VFGVRIETAACPSSTCLGHECPSKVQKNSTLFNIKLYAVSYCNAIAYAGMAPPGVSAFILAGIRIHAAMNRLCHLEAAVPVP